jgi:hypothetical protein
MIYISLEDFALIKADYQFQKNYQKIMYQKLDDRFKWK